MFRFLRHQTPLMIFVEILFALLLLMIFLASQGWGIKLARPEPDDGALTSPLPAPEDDATPQLVTFDAVADERATAPAAPADDPPAEFDCRELVRNGDFEDIVGWQVPITDRPASFTNEQVYSGERALKLGAGADDQPFFGESIAAQTLALPEDAEFIQLNVQIWQGASGNAAEKYLLLESRDSIDIVFQETVDAPQWQPISYNLTSLRGQTVRLLFGVFNNGADGRSVLYVDALSVRACRPPALGGDTPRVLLPQVDRVDVPSPLPTPPNHAPPAEMRSPDFGVNAFLWWRAEIADRDLGLIADGGFNWVRQSFAWEDIEIVDDSHDWSIADRVVQDVNRSEINLLARLGSDPARTDFWAGAPPDSLAKFVDYVAVLARRYNCTPAAVGCIQAYQIWNEPNLAREWGGNRPNPAAYLDMLGKAYAAIKRANPNAIVISAGMAPTGTDNEFAMPDHYFYEEMYRLMQGNSEGYFDLLGVNAAGFAAPPEMSPAQVADMPEYGGHRFFAFRHVEDIRAVMEAYGDEETRIAILEFGWTSDGYNEEYNWFGAGAGIDEFVKADYLKRAYVYAEENWQPWIALMSVLTMPNLDWIADGNPNDEEHYWWAIMEPGAVDELNFRPAYIALCDHLNQQRGTVCPYLPE